MSAGSLEVLGSFGDRFEEVLTSDALEFVAELHDQFGARRIERLEDRKRRWRELNEGRDLSFLRETAGVRDDRSWRVAGAGPGLEDRRVEITGPTDRRMAINALNSGASVWLADQEDATSPTWSNVIGGQVTLRDAIRRQIDFTSAEGRRYELSEVTPTIVMRPRGWHLPERHLRYRDTAGTEYPVSGSLVDFGLYFFHNAHQLIEADRGPYFYLAKLENHQEARLWNDVFTFSERALGITHGTVRATVLIETLPAAFEMEEILFELREHCAGLNAGRWDYIFSAIKNYRERGSAYVLPDRSQISMTVPFMRAYTELLVKTCHQRGAHAIGGMSAFIPNRRDPEITDRAFAQVRADKRREASDGFDGTWVAHPDLVPIARAEFDEVLGARPNQTDRLREDVQVEAAQLLDLSVEGGVVSSAGVRANVSVTLRYLESWLRGVGAAAIDNLMEDVATAEISRSQLWQWIHQNATTIEGVSVTRMYIEEVLGEVLGTIERAEHDRFDDATLLVRELALGEDFPAFLTLPAYERFLASESMIA